MYICTCPDLSARSTLAEIEEFFKIHYAGIAETLTYSARMPTLSVKERQARAYAHRVVYADARARCMGICPACGKEPERFTADFDHLGNFRGALCRACYEWAKMIDFDASGQVNWWITSPFCRMAAAWTLDWCAYLAQDHTEVYPRVCDRCWVKSQRWDGLGGYLAECEGVDYPTGRWHLAEAPDAAEGPDPKVRPLFLAPGS